MKAGADRISRSLKIVAALALIVTVIAAVEYVSHREDPQTVAVNMQLDSLFNEIRQVLRDDQDGRGERAVELYEEMISLAAEYERWAAYVNGLRGVAAIHYRAGRPDSAEVLLRLAHARATEAGHLWTTAGSLEDIGRLHAARGDVDSAVHYFRRAQDTYARHAGGSNAVVRLERLIAGLP